MLGHVKTLNKHEEILENNIQFIIAKHPFHSPSARILTHAREIFTTSVETTITFYLKLFSAPETSALNYHYYNL